MTIKSVAYDYANDAYYIGGDSILFAFTGNPNIGAVVNQIDGDKYPNLVLNKHLCINYKGADYLCSNTRFDNANATFKCLPQDLTPCRDGCINVLIDATSNESGYSSPTKSCRDLIDGTTHTELDIACSLIFYTSAPLLTLFGGISNTDFMNECRTANFYGYGIASDSVCLTDKTQNIILDNPFDQIYVAGQCINDSVIVQQCPSVNETKCFPTGGTSSFYKCVANYNDIGQSQNQWILQKQCLSNETCSDITGCGNINPSINNQNRDGSMFSGLDYGIRGLIWLIIAIIVLGVFIGFLAYLHANPIVISIISVTLLIVMLFTGIYLKMLYWWISVIIAVIFAGILMIIGRLMFKGGTTDG